MTPPQDQGAGRPSIAAIFAEIISVPPADRRAALERACHGSPGIAAELESLLEFHDDDGSILDRAPLVDGTTPTPTASFEPAWSSALPDGLSLGEVIGAGSRFLVHAARSPRGELVAVKIVRAELVNAAMAESFRSAAQWRWPRHPGIAEIRRAYSEGDHELPGRRLLVIEELVQGPSITEYAAARNLGTPARTDLILEMTEAAAAGHAAGHIHGDLQPGRVRVLETAAGRRVKVLGFGLSRLFDPPAQDAGRTHASERLTTLRPSRSRMQGLSVCVPPERKGDRPAAPHPTADVYALGAIAIEVLSGIPAVDVSWIKGRGAPALRTVFQRSLSQAPADRYADAGALAEALRAAVDRAGRRWWNRLAP